MSATAATVAYGLSLTFGGSAVAEATNIDGPNTEREMIDVTNLGSPDQAKEYLAGLIDGGDVTISVNYLPQNTVHKAMLTALVAIPQVPTACTIVLTDSGASVVSFNALVKSFKPKGEVAGKLAADFGLQVTGVVTYPT